MAPFSPLAGAEVMKIETIHINPTREQCALLAHASEGHVLITVIGSANDILWGQFADAGMMEATDLPRSLAKFPALNWNAWKLTERGLQVLSTIASSAAITPCHPKGET
jgi:hypothetical protein